MAETQGKELWEMYDRDLEVTHKQERAARKKKEEEERCKRGDGSRTGTGTSTGTRTGTGVNTPKAGGESTMFDVDAIRMELEKLAKEDLKLEKNKKRLISVETKFQRKKKGRID